jgi:transcriptional regulator with XRE-family HTH domain
MGDDSNGRDPQRPETVLQRVSANLRAARQSAGMTLEQLAQRSELHPVGVKRVEDGLTMPRLDTVVKLAGALEVPPAELCAGVDWDVERQRFE